MLINPQNQPRPRPRPLAGLCSRPAPPSCSVFLQAIMPPGGGAGAALAGGLFFEPPGCAGNLGSQLEAGPGVTCRAGGCSRGWGGRTSPGDPLEIPLVLPLCLGEKGAGGAPGGSTPPKLFRRYLLISTEVDAAAWGGAGGRWLFIAFLLVFQRLGGKKGELKKPKRCEL